jgi:hypothetical protein
MLPDENGGLSTDQLLRALDLLFRKASIQTEYVVVAADELDEALTKMRDDHEGGDLQYPIVVIQNTDTSDQDGRHWVAWNVLSPTDAEWFDSYGYSVYQYPNIQHPAPHIVRENCISLQSGRSFLCGGYSLWFVYCRSLGITYKKFIDLFSSSVFRNDRKVRKFLSMIPAACLSCSHSSGSCSCLGSSSRESVGQSSSASSLPAPSKPRRAQTNTFKVNCPEFCICTVPYTL